MKPSRICVTVLAFACGMPISLHQASAEVTFTFTFFDVTTGTGVGFDDPTLGAARREALEAVGAEIGSRIGQTATVEVGVAPSQTDGTGPIGIGSATFLDTTPGIRDGEVYRRIVLGEPDVDIGLDAGIVFDFGYDVSLSGTPAAGMACFRDVARHELTHVLGYGSFIKSDGTGFNETAPDMYTRFDSMLETDSGDGEGLPVVDSDGNLLLDASTFAAAHGVVQANAIAVPCRRLAARQVLPRHMPARHLCRVGRVGKVVDHQDIADVALHLGRDIGIVVIHIEAVHTKTVGPDVGQQLGRSLVRNVPNPKAAAVIAPLQRGFEVGNARHINAKRGGHCGIVHTLCP